MSKGMTIRDIAGLCPEEAVWKMLADVSGSLMNGGYDNDLSPDAVIIDGDSFMIRDSQCTCNEFLAAEHQDGPATEKEWVWSLGAMAYYAATGHTVFGGHGGSYQREHPLVSLPVLPKGMQALTMAVQKCLCYNPEDRIGLKELNGLALRELAECAKKKRRKVEPSKREETDREVNNIGEKWPEEMVEV